MLAAVAYGADGGEFSRRELHSAGNDLRIHVEPQAASAKSGEVLYVPVTIADGRGIVESNADRKLTVTVEGGELSGFGSANPCHEEQYRTGTFNTYYGRAWLLFGQENIPASQPQTEMKRKLPISAYNAEIVKFGDMIRRIYHESGRKKYWI